MRARVKADAICSPAPAETHKRPLCVGGVRLQSGPPPGDNRCVCVRARVRACVWIISRRILFLQGGGGGRGERGGFQALSPHLEITSCRHFSAACFQSRQEREKCPLGNSSPTSCLPACLSVRACVRTCVHVKGRLCWTEGASTWMPVSSPLHRLSKESRMKPDNVSGIPEFQVVSQSQGLGKGGGGVEGG